MKDAWELGPWDAGIGHTYFSLQYANFFVRLDRCYFSHNAEWIHHSLQTRVQCLTVLSDHFPLIVSWQGPLSAKTVPDSPKRLLIVNAMFLSDNEFEDSVTRAILALNVDLQI